MDDGRNVLSYVFDALRLNASSAIPAIPLDSPSVVLNAVKAILQLDDYGIGIILRLEDLMKPDPRALLLALASSLEAELSDIDLILDIGAPNFEPYEHFADALVFSLSRLGDLYSFRNLVLVATAIPETFAKVAKGGDEIPRHDWMFYKKLKARLPHGIRLPTYGDHTVVHPKFAALDMRKVKSSGKVIYTTPGSWLVHKVGRFAIILRKCMTIVLRLSHQVILEAPRSLLATMTLPSAQSGWRELATKRDGRM